MWDKESTCLGKCPGQPFNDLDRISPLWYRLRNLFVCTLKIDLLILSLQSLIAILPWPCFLSDQILKFCWKLVCRYCEGTLLKLSWTAIMRFHRLPFDQSYVFCCHVSVQKPPKNLSVYSSTIDINGPFNQLKFSLLAVESSEDKVTPISSDDHEHIKHFTITVPGDILGH